MTARYTVTYAPRAQRDLWKLPEKIATRIDDYQVLIEVVTIAHRADSYRPR